MRNSRRIKRMSRNRVKIGKMNLTSLMDVFTILVFFLLVNSGSVEVVEAPKDVKSARSPVSSRKPRETVVIFDQPGGHPHPGHAGGFRRRRAGGRHGATRQGARTPR